MPANNNYTVQFDFCLLFTIKETTLKKILNQSGDVVEC